MDALRGFIDCMVTIHMRSLLGGLGATLHDIYHQDHSLHLEALVSLWNDQM